MKDTQGKIWGETATLLETPFFSIHILDIKAGGFCSEHRHAAKYNDFLVISGRLEITIFREDGIEDKTTLGPEDRTEIEPGVWHKFRALEDTRCLEIYRVELRNEDIDRRSHGGKE
jgi:mannose-6-phosphate isomerase-like protein (cupin superfamily)